MGISFECFCVLTALFLLPLWCGCSLFIRRFCALFLFIFFGNFTRACKHVCSPQIKINHMITVGKLFQTLNKFFASLPSLSRSLPPSLSVSTINTSTAHFYLQIHTSTRSNLQWPKKKWVREKKSPFACELCHMNNKQRKINKDVKTCIL